MRVQRSTLPVLGLLLAASLVGCSALPTGGSPTVTVENRDDVRYRLTVYAVPDADTPGEIPFRATTAGGERRYTSPAALQSGSSYRNVTVTADGARRERLAVAPADTTSTTVDGWNPGDAVVYVVETTDDEESLVALTVVTCERAGQRHDITVRNGAEQRSSATCD